MDPDDNPEKKQQNPTGNHHDTFFSNFAERLLFLCVNKSDLTKSKDDIDVEVARWIHFQ